MPSDPWAVDTATLAAVHELLRRTDDTGEGSHASGRHDSLTDIYADPGDVLDLDAEALG